MGKKCKASEVIEFGTSKIISSPPISFPLRAPQGPGPVNPFAPSINRRDTILHLSRSNPRFPPRSTKVPAGSAPAAARRLPISIANPDIAGVYTINTSDDSSLDEGFPVASHLDAAESENSQEDDLKDK